MHVPKVLGLSVGNQIVCPVTEIRKWNVFVSVAWNSILGTDTNNYFVSGHTGIKKSVTVGNKFQNDLQKHSTSEIHAYNLEIFTDNHTERNVTTPTMNNE
jgi:hypothetical protein